jgi:hypothetical protein
MESCPFAIASTAPFAKHLLQEWIAAWPDVEHWRFEVAYEASQNAYLVCSTRFVDGKIWTARDVFPKLELENVWDVDELIQLKSKARHRDVTQVARALDATTDDKETAA